MKSGRILAMMALPFASPSHANGLGDLTLVYLTLANGQRACFQAQPGSGGTLKTIQTLDLTLTKSIDSPNGTSPGHGFTFELDLTLAGNPAAHRIYGCCTQAGLCGTGESCGDQPLRMGLSPDGLSLDLSDYPRRGPTTVDTPEDQRPTLGPLDRVFELTAQACDAN